MNERRSNQGSSIGAGIAIGAAISQSRRGER